MSTLFYRRMAGTWLAALLTLIAAPAGAQQWPAKPITIVNGFPAGAGNDIVMRMFQEALEKDLGTPLVFEYKPGAGGNVASEFVSKAAPDGYTFLIGTAGTHGINAALYKKLPFDVEADFTPVAPLADVPNVLAVNPDCHRRQVGARIHRRGEGRARQVQLRLDRQWRQHAPGLCPVQCCRRPRHGACALQGQPRIHPGPGDGRGLLQLRPGPDGAGPVPGRQGPAAGCQHQVAGRHPGRRADSGRGGAAGFESVTWYGLIAPKGLDAKIAERVNAAVRKAQEKHCPQRQARRHRHVGAQRDARPVPRHREG